MLRERLHSPRVSPWVCICPSTAIPHTPTLFHRLFRNLVWSLVLRSQKTRIWELTPPMYRLRSSSISAAALIAWTSFPLQGVVCLVGEAFSHLGTSLSISPLSFPSAFSDPVFEPACLPGLVLSRHLQGSRLWPLDLVVCDLHPLCLPLLVPTHLQGF